MKIIYKIIVSQIEDHEAQTIEYKVEFFNSNHNTEYFDDVEEANEVAQEWYDELMNDEVDHREVSLNLYE